MELVQSGNFQQLTKQAGSFSFKGDTYITHSPLLKGEEKPRCIPCHCEYTVKHILFQCIDLHDIRKQYYDIINYKELFYGNVYRLINFLRRH